MPMRTPRRGRLASIVAIVALTACAGAGTADRATGGSAPPSTTAPDGQAMDVGHGTNGMHTAGTQGAGGMTAHERAAAIPPLTTRLADARVAQRAAVARLVRRTRATLAPFESETVARAAGFTPNDTGLRIIHYRNIANRRDGRQLDPNHPEGLVYLRRADGALHLLGAVFLAPPGVSAPTPGGAIFFWHTHDARCEAFLVPAGRCSDTVRMLHIWTSKHAVDPWIQSPRLAFGLS
jgi:hypothetical protein